MPIAEAVQRFVSYADLQTDGGATAAVGRSGRPIVGETFAHRGGRAKVG